VSLWDLLRGVVSGRDDLLERLEACIAVKPGRRAGSAETSIRFDHRLPDPSDVDEPRARWRLATVTYPLRGAPLPSAAFAEWNRAEAYKGRRLTASDLLNDNRVAAIMSWHYEEGPPRPHLITSLALRQGIDEALRAEYMVALWLLTLVGLAIDRKTTDRGSIGVVLDNAIELDVDELQEFGFRRGPGPRKGGYDGAYYELRR
jgi:hypothetical protein